MGTAEISSQAPPYICGKCKQALVLGKVTASYLGSEFPVELWRCPGCGKVFVPESLATGKMLRVEQALEDK
jgi:RNase P subunit RPR2